jgi:ATP-dependent helicase HrpA
LAAGALRWDNAPAMKRKAIIRQIEASLEEVMALDAAWCRSQLAKLARQTADPGSERRSLGRLLERIEKSRQRVDWRRQAVPALSFDAALPINTHREEIVQAIRDRQVVIVAGETGSGKTTQLPKFCLQAERGLRGLVGCTQPRRIAASAMARRVAEELQSELGGAVGYQVRFRDRTGPEGFIKFMTDGILLAEIARDPQLDAYDTIIIDEAHERSLNIDFLLGYLKTLLPRRPDLRLIITSATIDTDKFARHFGGAPVLQVSGRGYPVEILYQPLDAQGAEGEYAERDLYQGIADGVRQLDSLHSHADILVFLSGEREIREAGEFLARQRLAHTEILPLYARLSAAEQQRVFHPEAQRRIILSTNVAETSLTVPRIRCVIDSGLARISRYAHRSRIQRLPIEPVSQASANQRAGRCGRIAAGTCIRLYSEQDFLGREPFTEPEILRTSLGSVVLRMLVMGLGNVERFPFIDRPAPRMIKDAYGLLFELGAVDGDRRPTGLGRQLDSWPIDVRLARMIVEGNRLGCLEDVLVLVAALSIQDPRERPLPLRQAADEAHQRFADDKSDFSGLLKLWHYLRQQRRAESGNRFRKRCNSEFLNWQRVLEWFDLYQQLRDQARESGLQLTGRHGDYPQVHQALLAGLLSQVGLKRPEDSSYQGARANVFHIFPGSGLFGRAPKWLMAGEIVETTKAWARMNAAIQPEWIERQGAHLLNRRYLDPHWSRRRGAVMAWEQVSLFGLTIVERRRVAYARIDAVEARRIFILSALVRGELDTRAAFMAHNQKIRAEVELLEHKRRRHDVLADEHAQFEFFDARVPAQVCDARSFERWLARLGPEGRQRLYLDHEVLTREDAGEVPENLFPDALQVGANRLPLSYHFEPGAPADGVTVRVPLELLNTLDAGQLQWLVPGLLREKLTALIRSLPKPLRRALTPVPAFTAALHDALQSHGGEELLCACASELSRMTGLTIGRTELDESTLPAHLLMRLLVVDGQGREMAQGRSLAELRQRLGDAAQSLFMDSQGARWSRDGARSWEFGSLARSVQTKKGVRAWPALVDQQDAVGLRLFDTAGQAAAAHAAGVLRLLALGMPDKLAYLRRHHGLSTQSLLAWTPLGPTEALVDELVWTSLCEAAGDVAAVRDEAAFQQMLERVRQRIGMACRQQADLLNGVLRAFQRINAELAGATASRFPAAVADIASQLQDLVYEGFLGQLAAGRLGHYPRYLAAVEERLRTLPHNPERDRRRMAQLAPWWSRYLDRLQEDGALYDEALDEYRWLVEEYRVSLFAQSLGTAVKVSGKRLAAAWQKVVS